MHNRAITARVGQDSFPILIGENLLNELEIILNSYQKDSVFILVDNFFQKETSKLSYDLRNFLSEYNHLFIEGGIEKKDLDSYKSIIKILDNYQMPKDGVIVAIGGGVIGDLTAFIASTYKRGINLIHMPTTTTAMIDSCIGGKTGLNYLDQVNLLGTYYNPIAIFIDLKFLYSLDTRDYYSGLCEAIKMALTSDSMMLERLINLANPIKSREIEALNEIIYWSVLTKLKYVGDDAHEKSVRLILNYGHTFGQSIETFYGLYQNYLRHGEAVAFGIKVAAKLSLIIDSNEKTQLLYEITNKLLTLYYLPNKFQDLNIKKVPDIDFLLNNLINDKKRTSKGNRFILCDSPGSAEIKFIKDESLIKRAYEILYL